MLLTIVIVVLAALIMLRVPVSFAIFAAGVLGLAMMGGLDLVLPVMQTAPATAVRSTALTAIPLFMLMAQFMLLSGLLDSLFDAARGLVGRIPGGTGIASIGAGTAFAAVSGSSTAAAATLAQTSTARMIREGYRPDVAGGLVASVGTLAAMIPPSIILVFYAITAEAPVGDVLVAGFFPGVLIAAAMAATMYLGMVRDRASVPMGAPTTLGEKARHLGQASPLLIIFVAVVGSIFLGIATPTEAAALGAAAALVLVIARRRFTLTAVGVCLVETVKSTAMILAIIMAAHVLGHFLTETRAAPRLVGAIEASALPALLVMALIAAFYVVLGFFMDQIAIIALTVPVVLPVVEGLGYDPVWFGIFMVLLAEVGMVTPPMGINVFVVAKSARLAPMTVFRGAFPYVVAMLAMAAVLLAWPQLVLWVPNLI
ncbi:C4-dicarboxylate ABC transporter permease [Corynebacterium sphenisci DSM 44792]|uniref:C4-dicarboxylate ABC transporter permease n=1 Tax=Corynebacterium sphenisci DSM 44792 TaxID=1437874 RepID=A0A1L7CYH3_9CORY|nr:TRAP transporter large permease [Corynebacterium sphenisci]APT90936.1 C4-dicarboxylate ABC transporter permease [Corynebacterium sphenisci DSM 44792]